jgi:hypothetical protein
MTKSTSQVFRIDFTLSFNRDKVKSMMLDPESMSRELKEFLRNNAEQYMFQFELTGTDNYHVQGRVNLKRKQRCSEYAKDITANFGEEIFYRVDCSPTNVHCRSFSYVMKPETRVAGPWANKPIFMGRSILTAAQLQHWHRRIVMMLESYDSSPIEYRKLINITDTRGSGGKSSLVRFMQHYYADSMSYVDIWGSLSQISNSIVGEGARKMYLIDLPKAFKSSSTKFSGDKVEQLASLLERVKDGGPLKGTMRGGFECLLFDPPITILFSNWSVSHSCFTKGRLVNLNLSDLYYEDFDPTDPNLLIFDYLRSWDELPEPWQWFWGSSEIYFQCTESYGHDNGVHIGREKILECRST